MRRVNKYFLIKDNFVLSGTFGKVERPHIIVKTGGLQAHRAEGCC